MQRAGHYIFVLWFLLLSIYLIFSSPILSCRRLDVYHSHYATQCGLVFFVCRSETCCTRLAVNEGRKKSPSVHHRTTLSGYIFAITARIDNRKNLLHGNIFPTCPHNMMNFGPLTAEICWWVWSTPANFNGFRVLATLLHGTIVVGVNRTLRRWIQGSTYIWQGGHHVGHWPTFLVTIYIEYWLKYSSSIGGYNTRQFKIKQELSNCWDGQPFGHNRHWPKSGGAAVPLLVELAPHLTQCGPSRSQPSYQVAS